MTRRDLIEKIHTHIMRMQDATHAFDDMAAEILGVNQTDLKCLGLFHGREVIAPSAIASSLGLSRGATTTLLDRLEQAGYIRREHSSDDRRSVQISLTEKAHKSISMIWGGFAAAGGKFMAQFSDVELATVARFLEGSVAVQIREMERAKSGWKPLG